MKLIRAVFEKEFVKKTMMIALPIMLQNGITNFVNMLDNIMVGQVGTDPMTGVSIVNSLLFVWNLCVFGGLSGISIFTAQYCGKGDHEGVRRTFRLQISSLATGLICVSACFMPVIAFDNASYFIIRSGGKTFITFLFDSCFCWAASVPIAFYLAHCTDMSILPMYAVVNSIELIKVVIGAVLVGKGIWIKDITV